MRLGLRVLSGVTALICLALIQPSETIDTFAMNMLKNYFTTTTKKPLPPKPEELPAPSTTKSPHVETEQSNSPAHHRITVDEILHHLEQDQFEPWLQKKLNESIEGDDKHFCINLLKVPVASLTLSGKFCIELDSSNNKILIRYDQKIWRHLQMSNALESCSPMEAPIRPFEVCVYFHQEDQELCTFFRLTLLDFMQNDLKLYCFNAPPNSNQAIIGV